MYSLGKDNTIRLHFTVSPDHEPKFKALISEVQPKLEKEYGVKFDISYSQQKKSTDTIAVTMDNEPFVEEDGSVLFRPAGHGALLENLNDIDGDVIFIKNIDNEVPDRLKQTTKEYKIAIGGLLLEIQEKVFEALKKLDQNADESVVSFAEKVVTESLGGILPDSYHGKSLAEKGKYLQNKLNRPLRFLYRLPRLHRLTFPIQNTRRYSLPQPTSILWIWSVLPRTIKERNLIY
jgi:hypothetical protein